MPTKETSNLTYLAQTRISRRARTLLHKRALAVGLKDATWLRNLIYRELGLLGRA